MKKKLKPEFDLWRFVLGTLRPDQTRHLWLLLYWPIYGLFFFFVEKLYRPEGYYSVYCSLDDAIPFCELFLIPYLFWFVYLIGMHIYTLIYDISAFKKMMEGRTCFIIAHRLSTIRDADMILVMRDGDIVEQGTHDDLIAAGGYYTTLYNSQFDGLTRD